MTTIKEKLSSFSHSFHEWNANRKHLPDVHDHPKFRRFASILVHIGFFAKALLYGSMGVVAMLAATSEEKYTAEGPETVIRDLRSTFGLIITIILTAGLFCYSFFAIFYTVFDIDRLGHHGAMPVLSRFGRVFSAGFYAFLGVVSAQTAASVKHDDNQNDSFSSQLGRDLFSTTWGKAVIIILGIVFIVVCIVYINYALRPAKFYRELATERMHPIMFHVAVTIARIGACGRILFFGAFGVVLIDVVAQNRGTDVGGSTVLGLEGVLLKIAEFNTTLLFVTGGLLFVYAVWCFILCFFRRLPAHYSQESAVHALGVRWRVKKTELNEKKLARNGMPSEVTGTINMPDANAVPLEDLEAGTLPKPEENSVPLEKINEPVVPVPTGTPAQ